MQKRTQRVDLPSDLRSARYALLRTYRRDGTAVDTPIWFDAQASSVVFRTKIGPKTERLAASPDVELTACDYRGQVPSDAKTFAGRATIFATSRVIVDLPLGLCAIDSAGARSASNHPPGTF
jgi:PPOX class probable F420-dependent enzyme